MENRVSLFQDRVQVNNGVLTISSLKLADIGMYQCVAENKHGRVFTNTELRVIGKIQHAIIIIIVVIVIVIQLITSSLQ